jgi:uncharacterized phage protein gp47/JayE
MAYEAPYVDEAGLHISGYPDMLEHMIGELRGIFGSDIYLDNDSPDYIMTSIFALLAYDVQQSLILAYNNNSPRTAKGTGLDRIVAVNGIRRTGASYSTCVLRLEGVPDTVIGSGIVQDSRGFSWVLSQPVTLNALGQADALATCSTAGRITAAPGEIHHIVKTTMGWESAINLASAIPGTEKETDTALRSKQALSVAGPSRTVFEGTVAAVLNATGVVRVNGYENDQDTAQGILPPHSITLVVEGGEDEAIAQEIYLHKSPGCYTNGDVTIDIPGLYGVETPIRFFRPEYVDMEVEISIAELDGFTDATVTSIKEAVHKYINERGIGESIHTPNLNIPVLGVITSGSPTFYVSELAAAVKGDANTDMVAVTLLQAVRIAFDDIEVISV